MFQFLRASLFSLALLCFPLSDIPPPDAVIARLFLLHLCFDRRQPFWMPARCFPVIIFSTIRYLRVIYLVSRAYVAVPRTLLPLSECHVPHLSPSDARYSAHFAAIFFFARWAANSYATPRHSSSNIKISDIPLTTLNLSLPDFPRIGGDRGHPCISETQRNYKSVEISAVLTLLT